MMLLLLLVLVAVWLLVPSFLDDRAALDYLLVFCGFFLGFGLNSFLRFCFCLLEIVVFVVVFMNFINTLLRGLMME